MTMQTLINRHREEQAAHVAAMGDLYRDQGFVNAGAYGDPLPENGVRDDYARLRDALGLPKVTFHGLRKSCLSMLVQQGMPLPAVARHAGHADARILLAVYARPYDEDAEQAGSIMGEIMGAPEGGGL